jgi:hypothetical protein
MASILIKLSFLFYLLIYFYLYNTDFSILYCFTLPKQPGYKTRDNKGRFRSPNQEEMKSVIPLS